MVSCQQDHGDQSVYFTAMGWVAFLLFSYRSDILLMQKAERDHRDKQGPKSHADDVRSSVGRRRILLLQGPVGPFFSDLSKAAVKSGFEVVRYGFNPADRIYGFGSSVLYKGSIESWSDDFPDILEQGAFDVVVGFGSARPGHSIARRVCAEKSIPYLSLEEGYIRPGLITAEWGGNNADSPLAGRLPACPVNAPDLKRRSFQSLGAMARHAALYYAVRSLFSTQLQNGFSHRRIHLFKEVLGWLQNGWKSVVNAQSDAARCDDLIDNHAGRYFLVPLQVPSDANLQGAACGWTVRRLVDASIASFASSAPSDARLVFKIHPMARGHGTMASEIRSVAAGNGISDRVDVLETGALGRLTRHCAGMITINSTSGLAAIAHGRPLLVVGRSVYAHPDLAICAAGNPEFDRFWKTNFVANERLRRSFLNWVAREALLAGSFYDRFGREVAARGLLEKISAMISMRNVQALKANPDAGID
jgi:capsular polysaccharide export protein